MAVTYEPNIDNIGGGGWGGIGGANNPLLWLITLGFLKGNDGLFGGGGNSGAGAGFVAGEQSGKIDCLAAGQDNIQEQIRAQSQVQQFDRLSAELSVLAAVSRDGQAAITGQVNDLRSQLAECCCEINQNINGVNTQIAQQTSTLLFDSAQQTQKILDKLCDQEAQRNRTVINDLERQLQTQTILNNCNGGGNGGGNTIDINVLAAALANSGRAQVAAGN
ncbi:TPA: hypothetical protein VGT17_005234 [Vibrio harveyi]|nr:hypothetical protein [Vibrio harveyi]HEQ3599232.1 hypothetical protein [Vibrio harveyi]HEQ3611324.1 hypothetical protein [Vibrio harveyi]